MRFVIVFVMLALFCAPVYAQGGDSPAGNVKMGGFEGPVSGAQAETVDKAKKLHQDSRVALTGHILSRVAGEKDEYIFKDDTGEIAAIIAPEQFQGYTITPDVKVRLSGKIGKLASAPDSARVKVKLLEVVK